MKITIEIEDGTVTISDSDGNRQVHDLDKLPGAIELTGKRATVMIVPTMNAEVQEMLKAAGFPSYEPVSPEDSNCRHCNGDGLPCYRTLAAICIEMAQQLKADLIEFVTWVIDNRFNLEFHPAMMLGIAWHAHKHGGPGVIHVGSAAFEQMVNLGVAQDGDDEGPTLDEMDAHLRKQLNTLLGGVNGF